MWQKASHTCYNITCLIYSWLYYMLPSCQLPEKHHHIDKGTDSLFFRQACVFILRLSNPCLRNYDHLSVKIQFISSNIYEGSEI